MLNFILYKIYKLKNEHLRDKVLSIIKISEKGEFYSKTLRRLFLDYHNIHVGMYSYGCFSTKNIPSGTIIGRYCSFAKDVSVLNGNHPLKFKSLHPFFYNPVLKYVDQLLITRTKLSVGHDVWIGQNALILPSVSLIDNGAVIGAGSVVTKNVPPFAVVAGNPAKIIKYRFSQKTIEQIMQSEWWNKDIDEIKHNEMEFANFLKPYE